MKILFAVSNEEVSESIVKRYQKEYKEIISYKNVYYFNAILKEIQKDKSYDRIVISEDLETFAHTQYDQIDRFIFDKLDSISDEASTFKGEDIPIILICSDRRVKSEEMLVKLFGIGIYNALIGTDRGVEELCKLIRKPRLKKEAKIYYKIDTDDVKYNPENENDVSEVEIQNILAHYKKLGKDPAKYVESFNNIATQYNDTQLKIICKFLPLNVRAVLEEQSPKYQQVMAFNAKVSDKLRVKQNQSGTSEKLLKSKVKEQVLTKPVVVPNAVNKNKSTKLSRTKQKPLEEEKQEEVLPQEPEKPNTKVQEQPTTNEQIVTNNEEPAPKRRGRPRKNVAPEEQVEEKPKKKRGRPKKVVEEIPQIKIEDVENEQEISMPGFEDTEENTDISMPGFENENQAEDITMPGFTEVEPEDEEKAEMVMPGFDDDTQESESSIEQQSNTMQNDNRIINSNYSATNNSYQEDKKIDISPLLTPDKRIACFVGTSKNGTTFTVNNVAQILSASGVNVAILDLTKNRNAYYIYTDNQDELRNIARDSFRNLLSGVAKGVQVSSNLTVYTSLPDDVDDISNSGKILETLLNKHTVILIDCDFETDIGYFADAQQIYLVQSMDVLTIQPLTAFLRELKAKGVLEESKLRVVLNKVEKLRPITEKAIIGGMSAYNDPSMSYMVDLFDKDIIKYISIPFDETVYVRYLEGLINCDISIKGYPKNFMEILKQLGNMVYPKINANTPYKPASVKNTGFTPSINSTLDQMRKY